MTDIMPKFNEETNKKFKKEETAIIQYNDYISNGLVINETYIPEELLTHIFCFVDHKTLLACQIVCKKWRFLIQDFVWHKKAGWSLKKFIPFDKTTPWHLYYSICNKVPFNKNLIKNHSGEMGVEAHWTIIATAGNGWGVECPPLSAQPLPDDPVFEGKEHCFVTSYYMNPDAFNPDNISCKKYQIIDLIDEGFSRYILDDIQPSIKISEWSSARSDCSSIFGCDMQLLNEKDVVLDHYQSCKLMLNNKQSNWIKIEYEFKNYGRGLRKIKYTHCGQSQQIWAGYYGSKMAGACVLIQNPLFDKHKNSPLLILTDEEDSLL